MPSEVFENSDVVKKITIMTPTFNEEAGIEDCYLAVREFFHVELPQYEYEHLFIDNCSEDKTVDILKKISTKDHKFITCTQIINYIMHIWKHQRKC